MVTKLLFKPFLAGKSLVKAITAQPAISFWNISPFSRTFASETVVRRERDRSLLLLPDMNLDDQIHVIEQKVEALIGDEPEVFLVEVRIKPTNNIKVFIDSDKGMNLDKLIQYNRKLYKEIDESGLFADGNFSLEVSSPGLDEPLKLHRQYVKNIGRNVEIVQKDGIKKEGKLIGVSGAGVVVEEVTRKNSHGKPLSGKKQEMVTHTISFDNIKTTIIQIKF